MEGFGSLNNYRYKKGAEIHDRFMAPNSIYCNEIKD